MLLLDLQDAFDPFSDTDEDDEMATKAESEDTSPGTPRPGSPIGGAPQLPVIAIRRCLPWKSKVRLVVLLVYTFDVKLQYVAAVYDKVSIKLTES